MIVGAVAAALLGRTFFIAGHRPIGWVVAAAVLAAAIERPISAVSRHMKRGFALILVLLPLLVGVGVVTRAVFTDLDHSVDQLKEAIPEAAERVEDDDRFGSIARDMDLASRAEKAVENIDRPSSTVADDALDRGSTFLVTTILTIFLIIWGPNFVEAGLRQIGDDRRRRVVGEILGTAFRRSQFLIDITLVQGFVIGVAAWGALRLLDVPAPTPLALVIGIGALVPVIGTIVGSLPAVLLVAGFVGPGSAIGFVVAVLAVQLAQIAVLRVTSARSFYAGPAVVVIAALIGFDLYGLGGAIFLTAIAVFGAAVIDTRAELAGIDLAPAEADPTRPPREDAATAG